MTENPHEFFEMAKTRIEIRMMRDASKIYISRTTYLPDSKEILKRELLNSYGEWEPFDGTWPEHCMFVQVPRTEHL